MNQQIRRLKAQT